MIRQIGKRLATAIPSVIGVIVVTFLLTRVLPGDTAAYFAGPAATPQAIGEIRKSLGLDRSLPEQFVRYVKDLARGEFGQSLTTGQPVIKDIAARLPASRRADAARAHRVDVDCGPARHSRRRETRLDHRPCLPRGGDGRGVAAGVLHRAAVCLRVLFPPWLGAGAARSPRHLLLAAAADHRLLPHRQPHLAGDVEVFRAALAQLVLPALTLAVFSLAPITRMTRASMLAVLSSDFVRTARASGLSPRTVIVTYAFRNAMLPVVTTLGMVFSFLLGANVLVEKVFAWPGIGSYAIEALIASDYAPVQGFVLTMAVLYVALNLMIDLLYGVIDPRVRMEG